MKAVIAKWLYRIQLSEGIYGSLFGILTFVGVFTILLGQYLPQSYGFALLVIAVGTLIVSTGLILDKHVRFWEAQVKVGTVRNQFLVDRLYQKEALNMRHQQLPTLYAIQALLVAAIANPTGGNRLVLQDSLDRIVAAIDRLESTLVAKKWSISPEEEVYGDS